jgi:PAS domain S-box-containing protein
LKNLFSSSIRSKLLLLGVLAFLPVVLLMVFNSWYQRKMEIAEAKGRMAQILKLAILHEEEVTRETHRKLAMLAEVPIVLKGGKPANEFLAQLLKNNPENTNFGVIRPDGQVIASAVPLNASSNFSDRPYFQDALKNKSFSIGGYQIGRMSGKPTMPFGYPVLDRQREVIAVVFTGLDISRVTEFEAEVGVQTPRNTSYVKLDNDGAVLTSYLAAQIIGRGQPLEKSLFERISKEKRGTFVATGVDGVERLYVFSPLLGPFNKEGGYALLGIPTKALFAEVDRLLLTNMAVLFVIMVFFLAIMWFGGNTLIIRPARILADAAKRLAVGDLSVRTELTSTQGELGQLGRTFDEMAGELEKKKEALRESAERFRNAFEHAAIGMALVSPDGRFLRVNRALCGLTGYSEGEMLAMTFQDITHPEDLETDLAYVRRLLAGEIHTYQMEKRYFHNDGHVLRILLNVSLVLDAEGKPAHFISQIQDITERKRAEERIQKGFRLETALRRIDEKILKGANFREALGIACDAIVEMGYRMCWIGEAMPDHTVLPIAYRGFDSGYLENFDFRWDDTPEGKGPTGISIHTGQPCVIQNIGENALYAPWRDSALQHGYLSSASFPLKSGEGKAVGVLHAYSNRAGAFNNEEISRLEMFAQQCTIAILNAQRLEELRDTTRRLAFHVNRMPLGYIVHDEEFRIVEWNPAAERIFGWSVEEAMGKHPFELIVPPEIQPHITGLLSKLREGDESEGDSVGPGLRKDGTTVICEWFSTALQDATGAITGFLTLVHDVTEKTKLEERLQTAQRMESVGTLAGGIAHDFNNALTGIVGFGELLRMRMAGDDQALHDLDEILRCAERATTLTRQLLTYARRQVIEPVNLDLSTLVADLMRLIGKVVGEHIEVKTSLEKDLPTIHADRGQIEQVLMNLCLNARDAILGGGRLLVETEDVFLEEEYVRQNPYMKTGRYALLTVSDTGIGMDEKTRERVFEPFFTTKGPDKGTGLGLAMVYGIVKQHGGFIHVYSEPGKGTAFKVYFPAIEAQPGAVPVKLTEEIVRGGTETILLAEDEEAIRVLVERTLKELGYTVLVARNGEEAIEMFRRNEKIVLAVLDVVMPRKGGKEAFEEMYKQNPQLKVIFMSGYSANAIHESFVLIAGMPFLQKPFGPSSLARKVREVLDTQ